jgi:two-component system sensor histidine kinase RegB
MRGEAPVVTTVNGFFGELVEDWRGARSINTLVYENRFGEDMPIVSDSALKQMIFNVLDNANEVSPLWVRLAIERDGDSLVLKVSDMGPGFAKEMLANFGKPYNSSKGQSGQARASPGAGSVCFWWSMPSASWAAQWWRRIVLWAVPS